MYITKNGIVNSLDQLETKMVPALQRQIESTDRQIDALVYVAVRADGGRDQDSSRQMLLILGQRDTEDSCTLKNQQDIKF